MAEGQLTEEEFQRRLAAAISPPQTGTAVAPAPPVRTRLPREDPVRSLQRMTPAGEIIPFDIESGAPFSTRLKLSFAPDEDTRKVLLQKSFSNSRIEPLPEHMAEGFIIRDYRDPETGQVKDLLVDEGGTTLKDLADLGNVGVEILGAYMAMRGGRPMTRGIEGTIPRTIAEAAIASTGGQLAGAATDIAARQAAGQPINPLEIAQRRNTQAALGAGMDIGLTLPLTAGAQIMNLRRGIPTTPESAAAVAARNRLAEETGEAIPFTAGQQTGSERLLQAETFLKNVQWGGGRQRAFHIDQDAAIRSMQDRIVEASGDVPAYALPNKDVTGSRAVAALRSLATEQQGAIDAAREGAVVGALRDLSDALDVSTGMASRRVMTSEAGNVARNLVNAKHEALNVVEGQLKADALKLGADQPFISTITTKRRVTDVVKKAYESPAKPGEPLATTPGSVLKVLEDVTALPNQTTWDGIRRVRNSVNRLINEGQILGDTDTAVLKQISVALTDSINKGAQTLPAATRDAVLRANKFYAEGIEGFQVKGITEILADPAQRKLGPFAIFDQAASSPDQYFRLKEALTKPLMLEGQAVGPVNAGNQAWNTFKQAMWTELWDASRKSGNRNLVDPKALLNRLTGLKTEVLDDLLGPEANTIVRSLRRLEVLDNPKLPADEALALLRQGGDTAPAEILRLAQREAELDKLYDNQVIRKFVKGDIGAESMRPGEFVDRFADVGPLADVKDVMNRLESVEPGFTLLVRQKKVQSILESAAKSPLENEASARKLAKEINTPEERARLEAVLGAPAYQRLRDMLDILTVTQRKGAVSARTGGSMSGGSQIEKSVTLTGILKALPKQAQYYFTGAMISNPRLYRMATGPVQPLDPSRTARAIILSDDFIRGVIEDYREEAPAVMEQFMGAAQPSGTIATEQEFQQQLQRR